MSIIVLLDAELTPNVNFSNFQEEENFFIFKIWDEKRAAATLLINQFG